MIEAGLRLDFLHEFPFCSFQAFPFMRQAPDGWWRLSEGDGTVPLLFSLKASKESSQ